MLVEERKTTRPSFQFYPTDWQSDTNLQNCSIGARGLWIELMCFMHAGVPYGYLTDTHGDQLGDEFMAKKTGTSIKSFRFLLAELLAKHVATRNEHGAIFSRRMVRDEHKRLIFIESGKRGGNPTLNPTVNPPVNVSEKSTPPPSSSPPPSPSKTHPPTPKGEDNGFDLFWSAYPKKAGKKSARKAWERLKPSVEQFDHMMTALETQKQSEQWTKDEGHFIPNPASWINGERWEDELPMARGQKEDDWRIAKPTAKH